MFSEHKPKTPIDNGVGKDTPEESWQARKCSVHADLMWAIDHSKDWAEGDRIDFLRPFEMAWERIWKSRPGR